MNTMDRFAFRADTEGFRILMGRKAVCQQPTIESLETDASAQPHLCGCSVTETQTDVRRADIWTCTMEEEYLR